MNREECLKDIQKVDLTEIRARKVKNEPYYFISYKSNDKDLVWPVFKKLYDDDYNLFIDQANFKINHELEQKYAINDPNCLGIIFFASEDSMISDNILSEIELCNRLKKRIKTIEIFSNSDFNSRNYSNELFIHLINENYNENNKISDDEKISNSSAISRYIKANNGTLSLSIKNSNSLDELITFIKEDIFGVNSIESEKDYINKKTDINNEKDNYDIQNSSNINICKEKETISNNSLIPELESIINTNLNSLIDNIKDIYNYTDLRGKDFNKNISKEEAYKDLLKKIENQIKDYLKILNLNNDYIIKLNYGVGKYRADGPYIYIGNSILSPGSTDGYHIAIFLGDKIKFTFHYGGAKPLKILNEIFEKNISIKEKFNNKTKYKKNEIYKKFELVNNELGKDFENKGYHRNTKEELIVYDKFTPYLPVFTKELNKEDFKDSKSILLEINNILEIYNKYVEVHKNDPLHN